MKLPGKKSLALSIISGESSPRPVFRWVENGKPRDANRTEVRRGVFKVSDFKHILRLKHALQCKCYIYIMQ